MIWDLFRSYLFSKRTEALIRSITRLSLLATFVGVAALVLVMSIMNGFNRNIRQKLLAVEPHVAIESDSFVWPKDPAVESLVGYDEQDLVLRTIDGQFSGAVARGMNRDDLGKLLHRLQSLQGQSLHDPIDLKEGEVFLGGGLARSIGLFEGDELTLLTPEFLLMPRGEVSRLEKVRIGRILYTDVPDFDSHIMLYVKGESLRGLGESKTLKSMVDVRLSRPEMAMDFKNQVVSQLGLDKEQVQTWSERNASLFFALNMEKRLTMGLLWLSVVVTSFSLIMVLLMLISHKQKDIGLFMTLGLSLQKTQRMFSGLGFLLAVSGTFSGLVTGVLLASLLEKYPLEIMPDFYVDRSLPSLVDWAQVGWIGIGLLTLSLLAAWLPVRRVLRLTPAEALRRGQ